MEKPSVALLRCQFFKTLIWEKQFFFDETWLNENISKERGWTDGIVKATLNSPLGKGKGLVVAESAKGWIDAPPLWFFDIKKLPRGDEFGSF